MKLLFLDTETTGLDHSKHAVIQIAGIIEIDGVERERFNLTCRPFQDQVLDPKALAVNKKTPAQIKELPLPGKTFDDLQEILNRYIDRYNKVDKFYLVGQNVAFDYQFLDAFFKRNGNSYLYAYIHYDKIDLVALTAAFKVAGVINPDNVRLETVAKVFGITFDTHDAAADIAVTREIFYRFIKEIKTPTLGLSV